jgi:transcriptional regulator of acetoin/glycerol metabolism
MSPAALERLQHHHWPRNLPELRSVLEDLVASKPSGEISWDEVDRAIRDSDPVLRARREKQRREHDELVALLDECGGNVTYMAARLCVDRGTIRHRMRKHGLMRRPTS